MVSYADGGRVWTDTITKVCKAWDQNALHKKVIAWRCNLLEAIIIALTCVQQGKPAHEVRGEWARGKGPLGKRFRSAPSDSSLRPAKKANSGKAWSVGSTSIGSPQSYGGEKDGSGADVAWMRDDGKNTNFNATFRAVHALFPTDLASSKCPHACACRCTPFTMHVCPVITSYAIQLAHMSCKYVI